jgi:hypothetical protein
MGMSVDQLNIGCCINEDVTQCVGSAVPGERSCDAVIRSFCLKPENANDKRCSCWSNPSEIGGDQEKLAQWVCFSRSCFGHDKLVPREWRDLRCPDYVSCRTQVKLKGNIRELPGGIKINQDCGAGADGALNLSSVTKTDIRSNSNRLEESRLKDRVDWWKRNWLMLAGAVGLTLLLLLWIIASLFSKKKSPTDNQ